jgi:hypothetical protein
MSWGDASTPLGCLPAPGVIDQDLPDGACADGEEVCAALPGNVSRTEQLELHLVNQFGGLKRMAHLFAGERNARSCPELIVHEREEAVDGGLIPCLLEEACHLSRGRSPGWKQTWIAASCGGPAANYRNIRHLSRCESGLPG